MATFYLPIELTSVQKQILTALINLFSVYDLSTTEKSIKGEAIAKETGTPPNLPESQKNRQPTPPATLRPARRLKRSEQRVPLLDVFRRTGGVDRREHEEDHAQVGADPDLLDDLRLALGEEVHVVEAGRA